MPDIRDLSSFVVFLFSDAGRSPIGTGFLVGYPVPGRDSVYVPLVITAKHVLGDLKQVVGRFSMIDAWMPGHVTYNLQEQRAEGDLWEHEDGGVDIVAFRIPHIEKLDYKVIPPDWIAGSATMQEEHISIGDRVIIPSLLTNFMGVSRNFPVFRHGDIALIPTEKVPLRYSVGNRVITTQQDVIFIDATAVPGASGSPVFLWPGPRLKNGSFIFGDATPYLLGLIHGFYPAQAREVLEIESSATKPFFAENSGIAIAFPASRILEILDRADLKQRIHALIDKAENDFVEAGSA